MNMMNVMNGEPKHEGRAKSFALPGGFRLLVGRDMYELQAMRSRLVATLGWGLALTVGLALAGGVVMSRSRVRRIGTINEAIGEVMAGDLSRRIPTESTGGDVEELVTRLNRMLDELEKLVEGVRRVSDNIAHDLRTPLARLKTRLERLRYAGVGDEADKAVEEADKLLATFAALLRIARIESGERRAAFQTVDLTGLVDDVAELYRPLMEEHGKKLVIHNAPDITVRGDRDMLFQAFANLLDNALKHTPADGRVELSPRESEQPHPHRRCRRRARDTGGRARESDRPLLPGRSKPRDTWLGTGIEPRCRRHRASSRQAPLRRQRPRAGTTRRGAASPLQWGTRALADKRDLRAGNIYCHRSFRQVEFNQSTQSVFNVLGFLRRSV